MNADRMLFALVVMLAMVCFDRPAGAQEALFLDFGTRENEPFGPFIAVYPEKAAHVGVRCEPSDLVVPVDSRGIDPLGRDGWLGPFQLVLKATGEDETLWLMYSPDGRARVYPPPDACVTVIGREKTPLALTGLLFAERCFRRALSISPSSRDLWSPLVGRRFFFREIHVKPQGGRLRVAVSPQTILNALILARTHEAPIVRAMIRDVNAARRRRFYMDLTKAKVPGATDAELGGQALSPEATPQVIEMLPGTTSFFSLHLDEKKTLRDLSVAMADPEKSRDTKLPKLPNDALRLLRLAWAVRRERPSSRVFGVLPFAWIPFDVAKSEALWHGAELFFLRVSIPAFQPQGSYKKKIQFRVGENVIEEFPLDIHVLPDRLAPSPCQFSVSYTPLFLDFVGTKQTWRERMLADFEFMKSYGISAIAVPWVAPHAAGDDRYERYSLLVRTWGDAVSRGQVFFCVPGSFFRAANMSPERFRAEIGLWLRLAKEGESVGVRISWRVENFTAFERLVRQASKSSRLALPPVAAEIRNPKEIRLQRGLDALFLGQNYPLDKLAVLRAKGACPRLWSVCPDAPAETLGIMCWYYEFSGCVVGNFAAWSGSPFEDLNDGPDGGLAIPKAKGPPLATIRLEQVRQAEEDCRLLRSLEFLTRRALATDDNKIEKVAGRARRFLEETVRYIDKERFGRETFPWTSDTHRVWRERAIRTLSDLCSALRRAPARPSRDLAPWRPGTR